MVTSIVFLFQDAEHGDDRTDLVAGFWTIGSQAQVNNIIIGLNCFFYIWDKQQLLQYFFYVAVYTIFLFCLN